MKTYDEKIWNLFLIVALIFPHCIMLVSATSKDKIDGELLLLMENASDNEKIPVIIWFTDINHDAIEISAKAEKLNQSLNINFTDQNILSPKKLDKDSMDSYIEFKREKSREAYSSANIEKFNSIFPKTEKRLFMTVQRVQPVITYASVYTPTITLKLTKAEIETVNDSPLVDRIYYDPIDVEDFDTMNVATNITQTAYIRDTLGFKGDGIKIGQIESYVPEFNNTTFTLSRTFADSTAPTNPSNNHADQVASIMVGRNGGIVPNATLYSTSTNRPGDWRAGIEWLLSQGVNVINISNTLGKSTATYGEHSRWIDHIAIQHDVHVIVAAGNTSTGPLIEASMGNNVICVGGIDDRNTISTSDDVFASFSQYVTTTYKPDLCAPATSITTPCGTNSGTSFAAPQVTAAVAQLCQQKSLLKTRQDLVKSILIAGTRQFETVSSSGTGNHIAMSYKFGSGMLDAKNSRYVNNSIRYRADTLTSGMTSFTQTFSVTSSDNFIRVALAWLRNSQFSSSSHSTGYPASVGLAQMTLIVRAPNGTTWTSSDTRGSVQVVAFVPPQTGTYTITVLRNTQTSTSTHFGVSWY